MANIINGTDTGSGGLITTGDSSDELQLQTAETARVTLTNTAVVVNEDGNDVDFRVEGDTDANLLFVDAGNDRVGVKTSSPAVAFDVVGQVRASTGILFGTDTAAANALDDYEEGTWTPGISFGGASAGVTYDGSFTAGTYTKTGRAVFYRGVCILTSKGSSTGQVRITGLPFTSASNGFSSTTVSNFLDVTYAQDINAYVEASATTIVFWNSGPARTSFTNSGVTNSSQFMVAGVYFV